jgi:hypothetical protein
MRKGAVLLGDIVSEAVEILGMIAFEAARAAPSHSNPPSDVDRHGSCLVRRCIFCWLCLNTTGDCQ